MFKRMAEKKQSEQRTVLRFMEDIKADSNTCVAKLSSEWDVTIVTAVLNRLNIGYFIDQTPTSPKVTLFLSLDALATALDEEFPEETAVRSVQMRSASTAVVETIDTAVEMTSDDTQSQRILSGCALDANSVFSRPLYRPGEQTALLLAYIDASLRAIEPQQTGENKAQFDARVRQITHEKQRMQSEFKQQFLTEVLCDEANEPVIFTQIQEKIAEIARGHKIEKITTVLAYPVDYLNRLNRIQLQQLHGKAEQVSQVKDAMSQVFDYLSVRGGMVAQTIRVDIVPQLPAGVSDYAQIDPLQHVQVILTAPNEALGYSLHNVLVIAEIINESVYQGNASGRFADETRFTLTYAQALKLKAYLGDLSVWYRDFETILTALFDADAEQYVKTGYKPLSEAVRTEIGREQKRMSLFMTPAVRARFNANASDMLLLFAQPCLDLTSHPQPEDMRNLLEWIYTLCDLRDSKNDRKTFVKNARNESTFVSLLSIGHLRQIYDEISALMPLTKMAREMGFASVFNYVELMELDVKAVHHQYLNQKLIEMGMSFSALSGNATQKRQRVEQIIRFPAPRANEKLSETRLRFNQVMGDLLNKTIDITLSPQHRVADQEPTQQECLALLPSSVFGRSFEIANDADLNHVMDALIRSPAYARASQAYERKFTSIGAEAISPTQRYVAGTVYMYPTLDACIDKLSEEFKKSSRMNFYMREDFIRAKLAWLHMVKKMVYCQKMHISDQAIERFGERFADIFKIDDARDDLGQGCNAGLLGRIYSLEAQLIAGVDDPFLQITHQMLTDAVEQSFNDIVVSVTQAESSMTARVRPQLMHMVGLTSDESLFSENAYNDYIRSFMKDLTTRYSPEAIYQTTYKTMCDNFNAFVADHDDEGLINMLRSLHFFAANEPSQDELNQFRVGSKWNSKRFEEHLPQYLVNKLVAVNVMRPGRGALTVNQYSNQFAQAIENKKLAAASAASRNRLFAANPPPRHPNRAPNTSANVTNTTNAPAPGLMNSIWGVVGGLSEAAASVTESATATIAQSSTTVNLGGDSNMSTKPGTGSSG